MPKKKKKKKKATKIVRTVNRNTAKATTIVNLYNPPQRPRRRNPSRPRQVSYFGSSGSVPYAQTGVRQREGTEAYLAMYSGLPAAEIVSHQQRAHDRARSDAPVAHNAEHSVTNVGTISKALFDTSVDLSGIGEIDPRTPDRTGQDESSGGIFPGSGNTSLGQRVVQSERRAAFVNDASIGGGPVYMMTGKAATPSVNLSNQSTSFFRGFAGPDKPRYNMRNRG
jgi:hypothetical protein